MIQKAKRLDYWILLIVACFAIFSTLVIQSATSGTRYEGLHRINLIMYAGMFIPTVLAAFVDYRIIVRYFSYILYGTGIVLLIFVLVSGITLNGSTRWLAIGSFQFQPSELVKIFVILALAKFLGDRHGEPLRLWRDIIPVLIISLIPIALIMKQPDLGTSVVYVSIMIGMLWMGNIRFVHILLGAAAICTMAGVIFFLYYIQSDLFTIFIKPHQLERILAFLSGSSEEGGNSWHVGNAILAISTGELFGKGYMEGYFVQNGYIPYDYADSIFVVIGEEFGFAGSAVLLLLYFIMIYRMIIIAFQSENIQGTYIIAGIVAMFTLQIFENIAMHTGMMPLTGIALPFISYGGSSLLINMISIGLVLSIHVHNKREIG